MDQALILAGGKGTRLFSITGGDQKIVTILGGKPFIQYQLERLIEAKFEKIHLAVGHRADQVASVVQSMPFKNRINLIYEKSPLGTGGAVLNAIPHINSKSFLLLNGDTFIDVNFRSFIETHQNSKADITILTTSVQDVSRFGEVVVGKHNRVIAFQEKSGRPHSGIINAGIYAIQTNIFGACKTTAFSFEDFLSENLLLHRVFSQRADGAFWDIGTPEDHQKFQQFIESGSEVDNE